jgi:hypothetical protein
MQGVTIVSACGDRTSGDALLFSMTADRVTFRVPNRREEFTLTREAVEHLASEMLHLKWHGANDPTGVVAAREIHRELIAVADGE